MEFNSGKTGMLKYNGERIDSYLGLRGNAQRGVHRITGPGVYCAG